MNIIAKALEQFIAKNEQLMFQANAGYDFKEADRLKAEIEQAKAALKMVGK